MLSVPAWSASEIADLLASAENNRTSNPTLTQQNLQSIEARLAELTPEQHARYVFISAYSSAFSGKLDKAIVLAESITTTPFVDTRVKANLLLANMNESIKDFRKAYSYLYEALKDSHHLKDNAILNNIYTVAAQLHISAGAYEKAYEFARTMESIATTERHLCISQSQQLHALIGLKNSYDPTSFQSAFAHCEAANERLMALALYVFTADIELKRDPAALLQRMQDILPELEKIGFQFTILKARYYRGLALLQLQRLSEAKQALQQVFSQAEQLQDHDIANKAVLHLAELAEQAGPQPQAVLLYKQHIAALNQHLSEYKERSIAYHLAQANYMENQNKLLLLQQQNAVLQLEAELKKQELWWTVLAGTAFICLLLAVLGLLQRKQRQLFLLANTDGLTGCLNRRRFSELAQQWLSQHPQQNVALLLFDIDLFKNINDRYGHSAGDAVLKALVSRLQQLLPPQGWFARLGGEEFAIWLGGASLTEAALLAEQCRLALCNAPLQWQQQQISISASFGVVAGPAPAELETLLQSADQLLYQAKTAGRNCCISKPLQRVE
ncbi:GGDEF domain-containing protein [Rheinheimera tilapiae]|uniref:diguanylate cyclase n=1 Tax=Rheinheimera tilapiae TaxID=875043 RepID=A0ABV6BC66_9GAMM